MYPPGIPCTTSLLTDIQSVAGKPYNPLKEGLAPCSVINCSAIVSNSFVLIPGFISCSNSSNVSATIYPAFLIRSSSKSFLIKIIIYCFLRYRRYFQILH